MIVVLEETIKQIIMNTIWISIISLFFILDTCNAETNEYSYLKVVLSDQETISYPPETGFLVQDSEGKTILNPTDLERLKVYKIETPITLFVFVSWNKKPDVYELNSGKLVLGKTNRTYKKVAKNNGETPPKDHFSRPTDRDYVVDTKLDKKKNHTVYLLKVKYFSYDEETGHDMRLEFSNGIIFYFKDGKAEAWQDGHSLNIKGAYAIKIPYGFLKISYNPFTKKMWWATSKN
ncbi:hypothetical protein H2O64_02385 [Kordia sp. YSTF-M3]|uniref:Uncharacterized protein n=1 Tax=Kordia aestuariivivens TaxID=2759037 RepID=A0ABR7Q542_9FLAO|nr:hypothetical protein [Kordia aestuariivivens]MBC8753501.1 hypothetical protein [Kordia aestuariivivens]